jgi:hypothetical protein
MMGLLQQADDVNDTPTTKLMETEKMELLLLQPGDTNDDHH